MTRNLYQFFFLVFVILTLGSEEDQGAHCVDERDNEDLDHERNYRKFLDGLWDQGVGAYRVENDILMSTEVQQQVREVMADDVRRGIFLHVLAGSVPPPVLVVVAPQPLEVENIIEFNPRAPYIRRLPFLLVEPS